LSSSTGLSHAQILKAWRENPVKFVWDHFRVEPDVWQKEGLEAFVSKDADKIRISLQACAQAQASLLY